MIKYMTAEAKFEMKYEHFWLTKQSEKHLLLYWTENIQHLSLIFHSIHPWLWAFWCFVLLGNQKKKRPGRRRVEEKDFHSVIQRHGVNASILSLTTSVNCRSDSPTHSTFLLEGEAETPRLKWDEECSKRCCSCPFLTPSPPLISPFPPRTCAETLTSTYAHLQRHAGAHKQDM